MKHYRFPVIAVSIAVPLLFTSSKIIAQELKHAPTSTQTNLPASPPIATQSTAPVTATAAGTNTGPANTTTSSDTSDDDLDDLDTTPAVPEQNVDPYEKFNRTMFKLNDHLDRWFLKPIATGYDKVTPSPIRKGVSNFFDNLDMLNTIPNDLLQGKSAYFTADVWRFMLNSTLGIGGLFDIATRVGLPKHHEDFGMTLAYWGGTDGLKPQPYLVLPLLGSTTTRDAFGRLPEAATWPFNYMDPFYYSYAAFGITVVSKRADLLPADKLVQDSFDPYIFVRSAYLQSRNRELEKSSHETNFPPYTTETTPGPTDIDNSGNEL